MAAIMTACGHGIPGAMLRKIWGMVVITDRFDRFLWPRTTFDCGRSCRGTPPKFEGVWRSAGTTGHTYFKTHQRGANPKLSALGQVRRPPGVADWLLAGRNEQGSFKYCLSVSPRFVLVPPPPPHYRPPPVASYMWRLRRPACTNKRKHRWGYLHGRLRALRCHLLQPRVVTSVGGCAAQDAVLQTAR